MKKALVSPLQNDLVVQIELQEFDVAPPLFWQNCPDEVEVGFTFKNGTFFPPEPAVPAPVTSVSMRQARLALLQSGMLAQVDGVIASLPSPQKEAAQIEWEYATSVEKNSQLVQTLSVELGLTAEQIDNLFNLASTL